MSDAPREATEGPEEIARHVLVVRRGPGANCSSIGSAVEMLFLSATAGAAILAAVSAALRPHTDDAPTEPPSEPPPNAPPPDAPPQTEGAS